MTCSGYPLDGLDSVDKSGKSGKSILQSKKDNLFYSKQNKKLTVFRLCLRLHIYIYLAYKGGLLYSVPSRKQTKQNKQLTSFNYSSHFHPFLCPCFLRSIFAYNFPFLCPLLIFSLSNSLLPPVYA